MLYQLYELRNKISQPITSYWKQQIPHIEPLFQNIMLGRFFCGFLDIFERANRKIEKPDFAIKEIKRTDGTEVKITEEIIVDRPFANLLHFKKDKEFNEPKVLIVAPVSGHYASLLRDTARTMLKDHDVYITDWKNARDVPLSDGNFSLDIYTDYLIEFTKAMGRGIHVIGVCQPVVQVMAFVAYMNQTKDAYAPATVTIMGGPLDPRANMTEVNRLAERYSSDWFAKTMLYRVPAGYKGAGRLVYPGVLQHL